ncbi:MAG: hypothetical protein CVT49_08400 [candidate division Zixibacteria bacterium HGW-Zixibacteria-1]|nr:MAG: hypothetical protein CVT49_08400 [candidate division Zixibacteria bacterium HGW-Zixibacteria-1]
MLEALLILFVGLVTGASAGSSGNSMYAVYDVDRGSHMTNRKDRSLTFVVGDSLAENFQPTLGINAWGKECCFIVDLIPTGFGSVAVASMKTINNNPQIDCIADSDLAISLYLLDDGSLEWEMRFDTVPKSNVLKFEIDSKNLTFYYQDSAFFDDYFSVTGPDWAQGSYAVYHSNRRHNRRYINGCDTLYESYATGKAFHIKRPLIYDSRGDSARCWMNIDTLAGLMTIDIPESFLENAAYPIVVDPTFGKTSVGAWGLTIVNYRHNVLWNVGQAETGEGEITGGYVYCDVNGDIEGVLQIKVHSYTKGTDLGSSTYHASSATVDITDTSAHWEECPMAGHLNPGITYIASFQGYNSTNNKLRVHADATGWGDVKYFDLTGWNVPDSLSGYFSKNDGFSTYIEYTVESGGSQMPARRRKILGGSEVSGREDKYMDISLY